MRTMKALQKTIAADGTSVQIQAYQKRSQWFFEVIDKFGNATQWQEAFRSSELAFERAIKIIHEEGIRIFIGTT